MTATTAPASHLEASWIAPSPNVRSLHSRPRTAPLTYARGFTPWGTPCTVEISEDDIRGKDVFGNECPVAKLREE